MNYIDIIKAQDFKVIKELFDNKKPVFLADTSGKSLTQSSVDYQLQSIYEYNVASHDIFDPNIRKDKQIKKDSGTKDANGNAELISTSVPVARIGLPLQELIVERRVGFMLSDPVKVNAIYTSDTNEAEKRLEKLVERLQNDNKMDYKNKEIARRMMSELECAEVWYFVPNDGPDQELKGKFTLKVKILSPALGDKLYPLFDDTGDMISFARGYKIREDKVEIEHFDVYTPDFEYKYVCRENTWSLDVGVSPNPIPNITKKIMVIYHTQPRPEWADVQSMIARLETIASNHADMNDYFGSPILTIAGDIGGWSAKGEQGKILELAQGAQANYLALASPPESIKMELENLEKMIYAMSQTPNISFAEMKGLGNIAEITMRLFFLDAHMAVLAKEEIFGIGIQRRLNLIKACIGTVIDTGLSKEAKSLQLKPKLTPYMPSNITELISNLSIAVTSQIMSKQTATELDPLISDSETEILRLQDDATNQLATGQIL